MLNLFAIFLVCIIYLGDKFGTQRRTHLSSGKNDFRQYQTRTAAGTELFQDLHDTDKQEW